MPRTCLGVSPTLVLFFNSNSSHVYLFERVDLERILKGNKK